MWMFNHYMEDPYNHITRDHSFGVISYPSVGDDPNTKPVEITKRDTIEHLEKYMKK